MTATEIENAARNRLNASASTFWSSTEIVSECLYNAMLQLVDRAPCIEGGPTTMDSVANQAAYTIPALLQEFRSVYYDGRKLEEQTDKREIDAMNLSTTSVTGVPTHYYRWGASFYLWPTPSTAIASGITIWSYDYPAVPAASDTPLIPLEFHFRLVTGTAYYMLLKEATDQRIPTYGEMWEKEMIWCARRMVLRKRRDKFTRVRLEENLLTNSTGPL